MLIAVLLIITLLIWWFYFRVDKKIISNTSQLIEELKSDSNIESGKAPENYNRVSFFHQAPLTCSLAIPTDWEKKYRQKEKDNNAVFYYLPDLLHPLLEEELFRVSYYMAGEKSIDQGMKILEQNNTVYFFNLFDGQIDAAEKQTEYREMQLAASEIVKSLKCFKQYR